MGVFAHAGGLLGRQREQAVLDQHLADALVARGSVLVVSGEPGIGKTALVDHAAEASEGYRIVRTVGVEREAELDYAALEHLCAPFFDLIPELPGPQREALQVAFGLSAGKPPSPFLVGLATLGLLSEAAAQQPLLCIVDDAQWLDHASAHTLAFVARRLLAERIALVFATREAGIALAGLPQLRLGPLDRRDARALLQGALAARLDESVMEQLVTETGGNPLAIAELPRGRTPAQLAGGFGLPAAAPLSAGIEQSYMRRLTGLAPDAQLLLLLAAAEPVGDPALLWRAAQGLGLSESAAQALESEGLLTVGGVVAFRHPLVRSAVYGAAEPKLRRDVHRALAEATDARIDPDRHAWHRAQAALLPDEEVAAELESSAARAQARGGLAAAAAFLERSVALTPDAVRRAQRSIIAAQTHVRAGALGEALALLRTTEVEVLDELDRARVDLLRAQIAFVSKRGKDAPLLLLAAARRLAPVSATLASETHLEALSAALFAGRLAAPGSRAADVAMAAKAAPAPAVLGGTDLLLAGLATFFSESYEASVPILRRANEVFDTSGLPFTEQLRWKWLVAISCNHLWDDERWQAISERYVMIARETGALAELPLALNMRVYAHLFAGELPAAAALLDEIQATTEVTGISLTPYGAVGFAAFRGHDEEAGALVAECREDALRRGEGIGLSVLDWATAALSNGLGRYSEALDAALRVFEYPHDLGGPINWGIVELVEAAVRAGRPDLAGSASARLIEMSEAAGTSWARGVAARSAALVAEDERAEALFLEALDHLGRTTMAVDRARTHLLYGEWLRRRRRRHDSRGHLRTAHAMFSEFGMDAFAERARLELEATGEHAERPVAERAQQLTSQEAQVARLARDGLSNAEIGARLFISKHTVEYHLRKVFAKLGINSRTKLAQTLQQPPD